MASGTTGEFIVTSYCCPPPIRRAATSQSETPGLTLRAPPTRPGLKTWVYPRVPGAIGH